MNILIVDDEAMIRAGIRKRLEKYGFFYDALHEAEDGLQARQILETEKIDIAFVDINMPHMSGLELIRQNRQKKVAFVVVSGYDTFEYVKTAWKLGAHNYLLKPIDRVEFVETMRELYAMQGGGNMLSKILDNIRQNCLDPAYCLTVARQQLDCSESYICRTLKNERNTSFNELVNQYRIDAAKRWIDDARGRLLIKELAVKAGFNSQQYFSVVFKKYEGISPAQYIQQAGQLAFVSKEEPESGNSKDANELEQEK